MRPAAAGRAAAMAAAMFIAVPHAQSAECHGPRVFIYNVSLGGLDLGNWLTPRRVFGLRNGEKEWLRQYKLVDMVAYRVLASPCRVIDPLRAELFIVPLLLGTAHTALDVQGMCQRAQVSNLVACGWEATLAQCPLSHFSNRTAGRHVFILSREHLAHRPLGPSLCQGWWGDPVGALNDVIRVATSEAHPDFSRHYLDGSFPRLFEVPFAASVHVRPNERLLFPDEPRSALMTFSGSYSHSKDPAVRRRILRQCTAYNDSSVCLLSNPCAQVACAQLEDSKRAATFCLEPAGDTPYRKSYADSVAAGCIPVTFHTATADAYGWLWRPEPGRLAIDREAFISGRIDLREHLNAVPHEQLRALKRAVRTSARRFQVSLAHDDDDLVGAMLRHARRLANY